MSAVTTRNEIDDDHGIIANDNITLCKEVSNTTQATSDSAGASKAEPMSKQDALREDSVRKRRLHQDRQGEKMKKRHAESLKQLGIAVQRGSMVTIHTDYRIAYHARGITAVVVDCNSNTGGIIACASRGIIVKGNEKKEWWIPADMYKLRAGPGELYTAITPDLALYQSQIISGTFDSATHTKCTIGEAHAHVVGASSPCKRNNCVCKDGKCSKRCGCVKNKLSCSSSCSCSGNCAINPKNHNK